MKPTFLRQPSRSLLARLVATTLVPMLTLASVPASAAPPTQPAAPPAVKVNRTVPKVRPVPLRPVFSAEPSDSEIFKARIFEEPFVPVGGRTTPEENRALADAIEAFVARGDRLDLTPFERFLRDNDASPWRASLRANMGLAYMRAGRFTRAAAAWEEAWGVAKDQEDVRSRAVADRALGELANLRTLFAQVTEAERLLHEAEGRRMSGSAVEKLNAARVQLAARTEHPNLIHPTGAIALSRILTNRSKDFKGDPRLEGFRAPQYGSTLTQIEALAKEVGLDFQMAYHADKNVPIEVPSVAHLSMGHYAAVVARNEAGTRYLLDDPAFEAPMWVTRDALLEEVSGYFLIGGQELPPGWHAVEKADGDRILGRCLGDGNPDDTTPQDDTEGGDKPPCPPKGMATYSFLALTVSLHITDTPVGYTPPRGPAVNFKVTYNHKEATQPQTFDYSNLGSRWTFDQLSFIEDEYLESVKLHVRGGGMEVYTNSGGQGYAPHFKSQNVLVRVSSDPIVWEVRHSDGSVDVYSQPDCDVCSGRRVFMTESRDPAGDALSFTYDEDLRLVAITDALDQVTTLSYEPWDWKVTRVTDPFGRSAQFEYDAVGKLVRITDVIGLTSEFQYASSELADFITALTTPYGTTTFRQAILFGGNWSTLEATDPLGGTERIAYGKFYGQVPPQDDPSLVPTGFGEYNVALNEGLTHYWNKRAMALYPGDYQKAKVIRWFTDIAPNGRHTSGVKQSEKLPLENRVWYAYEGGATQAAFGGLQRGPSALPTKIGRVLDDGTSQIYRYEYNPIGNKIRETDPLGRTTIYTYAANGIDLLETRRVRGQEIEVAASSTYNDMHQPLTITNGRGNATTYTYNTSGQVLTVTTPPAQGHAQGATATYVYDANGYLTDVNGPVAGANTHYTYDDYGRQRTVTDAAGLTLTYDYDALDRVTRVTYPDGTYEEMTYNRLDTTRRRDRLGRWTESFYDALRHLVSTKDPAGGTTQYYYGTGGCTSCGCGDKLVKLIDANGNATAWEYDLQGRVTQETRADASSATYAYETTTGRLKQKTDRKGVTTTLEYFLDGKLKRRSYSDSTTATNYTYDPVTGRMLTAANGTDALAWTYDSMDRVATESSATNASTVGFDYDDAGNRALLTLDGGTHVTYGYDQYSRLTSITRGSSVFGPFVYDTASRRTSMTYPNGIVTSYGYDAESRLTSLGAVLGATPITSFVYGLDAAGNRTSKTTLDWAESYGYDAVNRLVTVNRSAGTPSRWRFAYDASGNRTAAQTDDAVLGASFNNVNELLTTQAGGALAFKGTTSEAAAVTVAGKPAQTTAPPQNAFSGQTPVPSGTSNVVVAATDPSGNTRTNIYQVSASGAGASYTYDANGNLATKSEGSDSWTYEWNAENQLTRVTKNSAEMARFSYDPLRRRVERTVGGVTTRYTYDIQHVLREARIGAAPSKYVYGPRIDEPLAREDQSTLGYYHADALGSVLGRTDPNGAVLQTWGYDTWGNLTTGVAEAAAAFTARDWDPETALYYYRNRYYDPTVGRFIGEDPAGLIDGPNGFAYARNAPTTVSDPYGLFGLPGTDCAAMAVVPSVFGQVSGGGFNDQRGHCIAHCYMNKCIPFVPWFAGVGWEVWQTINHIPEWYPPSPADICANGKGAACAFGGKNCWSCCWDARRCCGADPH
jgi:RHS repeat-associated protein